MDKSLDLASVTPTRRYRRFFATALIIAFLSSNAHAKDVGVVSELDGTASLKRAGETSDVALSMPVQAGDELATAADSHLGITLADESKLTLDSSTTLLLDEKTVVSKKSRRFRAHLFGGGIRALVTPLIGKSADPGFTIGTKNVITGVRGTDFELTYDDESRPDYSDCFQFSDVGVNEGEVEVTPVSDPGSQILVDSGYATTVACSYKPTPPVQLFLHPMWRHHHDHDRGHSDDHDHHHDDHHEEHHDYGHGSSHHSGHH